MRIVGRRASLRQRGKQNEAGDTIEVIRGEFDAGRSALGRAEQHDTAAASGGWCRATSRHGGRMTFETDSY